MAGVNKVIILGNLGKDPEIRNTINNKPMATFSLATTESYSNQAGEKIENTEWHNVVFFGKVVDVIEKYLKKGNQVYIEGKLSTRSYEKEGVTHYSTQIIGENLTLLGNKGVANGNEQPDSQPILENNQSDDLPF